MKTKKGFTLIELLIVIAIIGILSAALLPTILNAPARGRDAARQASLSNVTAALEAYNSDAGHYPNDAAAKTGQCLTAVTDFSAYFTGGKPPEDPSGAGRTVSAPATDPGGCINAGSIYYRYIGEVGVAEYILATVMENPNANNTSVDPEAYNGTLTAGTDYYITVH